MQMSKIFSSSLALDSVKFDVWTGPKNILMGHMTWCFYDNQVSRPKFGIFSPYGFNTIFVWNQSLQFFFILILSLNCFDGVSKMLDVFNLWCHFCVIWQEIVTKPNIFGWLTYRISFCNLNISGDSKRGSDNLCSSQAREWKEGYLGSFALPLESR